MAVLNFTRYRALLLDMDGTLFRGQTALPGADALIQFCEAHGIAAVCVTNNSTLTPGQYQQKLAAMGIHIAPERIVTSSTATRRYLETQAPAGTLAYAIGMEGLREALFADGYFVEDTERPAYVVSGLDRDFSYEKARIATLAIRAGATFVGTNPDTSLPTEGGMWPGAGSIQAMIQSATGIAPFVVGKPAPAMMLAAAEIVGVDPAACLVVGDRLDTDIAGAIAANMDSVLVLTGVDTAETLAASPVQPTSVLADLPALLAELHASASAGAGADTSLCGQSR